MRTIWIPGTPADEARTAISGVGSVEAGAPLLGTSAFESVNISSSSEFINISVDIHEGNAEYCSQSTGGNLLHGDAAQRQETDVSFQVTHTCRKDEELAEQQPQEKPLWYVWLLVVLVVLSWGGAAAIYSVASKFGSNSASWTSVGLSLGMSVGYIVLVLLTIAPKKERGSVSGEVVAEVADATISTYLLVASANQTSPLFPTYCAP
jgi:hypothetical protein